MNPFGIVIMKKSTYNQRIEEAFCSGVKSESDALVRCEKCSHAKPSKSKDGMLTCSNNPISVTVSPQFYCADGARWFC